MTPREPLNHSYAMVSDNMMVRRLLSVPNWDPSERKRTKGGHLLILRGVQFGPKLFPEIVIPRNHAGPLVDSAMGHDAPFRTVGSFRAMDPIFPSFHGDLALFTAEEVAKLKELGVLTPQPVPECPPLFPPLVTSSRGKVVSAALGTPPPETKADGIEQSLIMDQDEESILSDSYSDCQKPRSTECQDKDSHRSSDKDHDKNRDGECDRSRKGDI